LAGGVDDLAGVASSSAIAFCVALLWLIHPAHSAAVDYVSGRADSLAAFFSCGAWLLFLKATDARKTSHRALLFILASLSCLLALASRESACIWVLIFLLHLVALERRLTVRARAIIVAATLSLVGVYVGLRHLPHVQVQAEAGGGAPWPARIVLMLRALGDYGRLLLFPANLHMERTLEAPEALLGNAGWRRAITSEYLSLGGLLFAAVLCCGAFRAGRARVIRACGAAWFVIAFLPISNLIPLNATVAEHWLYLPSIGFLIFLSGCVLELPASVRRFVPAVVLIALLALVGRSIHRSGDWVSAETFYRRSLAAGGAKPRMALNLGLILVTKGDYAKAEDLLRRVVKIHPDYPIASNALGHALFRQGKFEEARKYFLVASDAAERTRNEYPRTWIAALNIAHMHYRENDLPAAIATADKARIDYPGTWELISFESEMLRKTKGPADALPIVEEFVRENWWHADAAIAVAKLYSEAGSYEKAKAAFWHASRLDIQSVEALNLLALLQVRQNRFDDALKIQRRALGRQPDQPRQHLLLADILEKLGRSDEARTELAEVNRLERAFRADLAAN
jgi:Flp pilus assembly protein TadD